MITRWWRYNTPTVYHCLVTQHYPQACKQLLEINVFRLSAHKIFLSSTLHTLPPSPSLSLTLSLSPPLLRLALPLPLSSFISLVCLSVLSIPISHLSSPHSPTLSSPISHLSYLSILTPTLSFFLSPYLPLSHPLPFSPHLPFSSPHCCGLHITVLSKACCSNHSTNAWAGDSGSKSLVVLHYITHMSVCRLPCPTLTPLLILYWHRWQ